MEDDSNQLNEGGPKLTKLHVMNTDFEMCTRRTFAFRAINIKPDIITNFCVVILLC